MEGPPDTIPTRLPSPHPPRVGVFFGFVLLALGVLWPTIAIDAADRMTIGTTADDFLRQFYPYRAFVANAWASGQVPTWNPHQFAGTPAWADPQLAVLYPWRLLQVPFAVGDGPLPLWTVTIEAIGHLALAGFFTLGLVLRLGARPIAAALAGVVFATGGFMTGYPLQQLAVLDTAVWIPATLWALTSALGAEDINGRRRAALLAGLATALAVFAGHPQTVTYVVLAGMGWVVWRMGADRGRGRENKGGADGGSDGRSDEGSDGGSKASRARMRLSIEVAVVWLASATGLSAAQWWPTLNFARAASRAPSADELLAGLPILDVVQLAAPHAVSCFSPLYVGAAALALAGWGALRVRSTRPWLTMAVLAWLISLGGNGPIVPIVFRFVPALAIFRHQERSAVLVALGLAIAAGLALQHVLDRSSSPAGAARTAFTLATVSFAAAAMLFVAPSGEALAATCRPDIAAGPLSLALADGFMRTAIASGALALVLGGFAAGRIGNRAAGIAVVAIAALELVSVNRGHALAPISDGAESAYGTSPIVEALRERARDGRISSEALLPGGANAASVHGLYDVTGDSPLQFAAVANLVEQAPEMVWWRLLGVRYAVTDREIGPSEAGVLSEVARDGPSVLYEVGLPVPPAWAAPAVVDSDWMPTADLEPQSCVVLDDVPDVDFEMPILVGSGLDACGPLSAGGLDLGPDPEPDPDSDVGSGQVPDPDSDVGPGQVPDSGLHNVQLTGLDPGRAIVTALLAEPAAVVLSTAYDPGGGWTARARAADGRVLQPRVMRAYGALPAVLLPEGEWTIQWRYRPRGIIFGSIVSAVTLLLALAGTFGVERWRHKPYTQS